MDSTLIVFYLGILGCFNMWKNMWHACWNVWQILSRAQYTFALRTHGVGKQLPFTNYLALAQGTFMRKPLTADSFDVFFSQRNLFESRQYLTVVMVLCDLEPDGSKIWGELYKRCSTGRLGLHWCYLTVAVFWNTRPLPYMISCRE